MGLTWSSVPPPEEGENTPTENSETSTDNEPSETPNISENLEESDEERMKRREEQLIKFKEDLAAKRDLRKKKLGEVTDKLKGLEDQLQQEVAKRQQLEQKLSTYKVANLAEITQGLNATRSLVPQETKDQVDGAKISAEIESLRISRYEEDDEDEVDILDEEDDQKTAEDNTKNKRKGLKKRVSFSLELVKEEEFDPREPPLDSKIEVTKEAVEQAGKAEEKDKIEEVKSAAEEEKVSEEEKDKTEDGKELDPLTDLTQKNKKLESQVTALKDVVNLSKQLLNLRETQVTELNEKLSQINEKEKDFERKLNAMRELRKLYDERGRAILVEHKHQLETERTKVTILESKLRLTENLNEDLVEKNNYLKEKVKNLDNQLDAVKAELSETKIKLATEKESLYHASSQISLINNLVSQIISGPELDLDHLARFLEENHTLINELTAKGDIDYVASALVGVAGGIIEIPKEEKSDIAENLGKVWRVLIELLSHHKKSDSSGQEWESCYKSVDTPKGPKLVISVSQTFIKLKDLILEKNSLVKEVGRLKTLNEHLENRMEEEGNRLTLVTEELHNTWDVVNKLKRQHDNLHTHERILKHELQHKRSMLNGLKSQLELCREQWALAREKNSKTENDWMLLRAEFASRKQKKKFFSSAESGYEEEEIQSPEYDTDDEKSLEIEEESPENSLGENLNQPGSVSPSDISTSESNSLLDECNGPISEILDGIFDEAYKIANSTTKTDQNQKIVITNDISKKDELITLNTDSNMPILNDITVEVPQNDRIMFCDVSMKRLEQIPEVEEDLSNDNSLVSDDIGDKLQIISVTDLKAEETQSKIDNSEETEIKMGESTLKENQTKSETGNLTTDEILRRRDERLKRMEESCKSLFVKMGQTSHRGNEISNKLDQIHAVYGPQPSTDAQPPISDQSESNPTISQTEQSRTETQNDEQQTSL